MKKKKETEPEPFSHQPFKKLGAMLPTSAARPRKSVLPAVAPEEKSDEDIFREAMKGVRQIDEFRSLTVRKGQTVPSRVKRQPASDTLQELEEIVRGKKSIRLADTQEFVEWVNPGYRGELIRELHKGRFAVQDYLDLHGYVLEEAEEALKDFLREARQKGYHCIKIIHGRGLRSPAGPVLKKAVIDLLSTRYRKHLIGFCTARHNEGGLVGMFVVLF
jgi:DNA-nicking Smr family endonuclease